MAVTTRHTFKSSSNPNKSYTVLVAADGQMSCDCMGWTRRVAADGSRSCTHTKQVAAEKLGLEKAVTFAKNVLASSKKAPVVLASAEPDMPVTGSGYVNPMLATPLEGRNVEEFGDGWWLEEKFDGHRVVVSVDGSGVQAWSRPRSGNGGIGLPRTLPPHVLAIVSRFPWGTYDGELIVPGQNSWDVVNLEKARDLVFVVFDVLRLQGKDITKWTADKRRDYLVAYDHVLTERKITAVRIAEVQPVTRAAVEAIWKRGGEGAILKRAAATYQPGARSTDWIKVKKVFSATLTVTGFEAGKLGPHAAVLLRGEVVDSKGVARMIETRVKTLNNDWLREFAANSTRYVGRKLRIEHQGLFKDSVRHPMFDHFVEEGK